MLKVTIKLPLCLFFYCALGLGCNNKDNTDNEKDAALHLADSLSEARIDSANKAISDSCDTLRVHMIPRFVDSLIKRDTIYMDKFFNNESAFIDSNKKVEKIIRQLQADCDSNLRTEAFKKSATSAKIKARKGTRS